MQQPNKEHYYAPLSLSLSIDSYPFKRIPVALPTLLSLVSPGPLSFSSTSPSYKKMSYNFKTCKFQQLLRDEPISHKSFPV